MFSAETNHRKDRAYVRLREEVAILNRVAYKSRNAHRPSKVFKELIHLKRLCNDFLSNRLESKVNVICKVSEDLYILATSNIPDGYFAGYTLIILGLCSRIHYLVREVKCIRPDETDCIDEMFAEIE